MGHNPGSSRAPKSVTHGYPSRYEQKCKQKWGLVCCMARGDVSEQQGVLHAHITCDSEIQGRRAQPAQRRARRDSVQGELMIRRFAVTCRRQVLKFPTSDLRRD